VKGSELGCLHRGKQARGFDGALLPLIFARTAFVERQISFQISDTKAKTIAQADEGEHRRILFRGIPPRRIISNEPFGHAEKFCGLPNV